MDISSKHQNQNPEIRTPCHNAVCSLNRRLLGVCYIVSLDHESSKPIRPTQDLAASDGTSALAALPLAGPFLHELVLLGV